MENRIAKISVYYSPEEWASLIKKCIIPVIQSMGMNREDSDINVLLKLYGNNELDCQLIIYGISEHFAETVSLIENRIKDFVEQSPSKESEKYSFKPGQVLWMPQKNNSVSLHYTSLDNYFKNTWLLFYRQSITNLFIEWFDDNEDMLLDEDEVYSFILFIQLILLKTIAHYVLPVNFEQLFTSLEASVDPHNNMSLYTELIANSSADYIKNIEQVKEYYHAIDFESKEEDTLYHHYATIRSILFDSSGNYSGDHAIKLLMYAGYDMLGLNGIKQLYIQNILITFHSNHLTKTSTEMRSI